MSLKNEVIVLGDDKTPLEHVAEQMKDADMVVLDPMSRDFGMWPPSGLTMIMGARYSGKSLFRLQEGLAGEGFAGRSALYVDPENSTEDRKRWAERAKERERKIERGLIHFGKRDETLALRHRFIAFSGVVGVRYNYDSGETEIDLKTMTPEDRLARAKRRDALNLSNQRQGKISREEYWIRQGQIEREMQQAQQEIKEAKRARGR